MKIYLTRHGETTGNKNKITQGHKDYALTNKGKKEAEEKSLKLKNKNIKVIYTSDLGRCLKTAQILNKVIQVKIIKTKALRERNFGKLNGYENKYVSNKLDLTNHNLKAPQGESFNQMKKRVIKFIRNLKNKNHKRVLIVTHEGPTRTIISKHYKTSVNSNRCNTKSNKIYPLVLR